MAVYEIPLKPEPQTLSVLFPTGVTYQLRLIYANADVPAWILDINDAQGKPILQGIPLVTGADLLAQYAYAQLGVKLFCTTDGDPTAVPQALNLGRTAHLWLEG
jgi:hypothetical protein